MKDNYKQIFNSPFGQSLVEVVISIALASILAISLITTTLITQRTSRAAKNNSQATKFVQESVEKMRVLRDRRGFDYIAQNMDKCKLNTTSSDPFQWFLYGTDAACPEEIVFEKTIFHRRITIENDTLDPAAAKKLVTVEVSWDEPDGLKTAKSQTYLSRWETR